MKGDFFELMRVIAVVAMLIAAAALATPKGKLPLALAGLAKLLNRERRHPSEVEPPAAWKRFLALVLVLAAVAAALY